MIILKKTQKDDAVSPVVGVMLMLVVTIVIAALVAAFASGLGTDSSSTTTAIFTVQDLDTKNGLLTHIYLVHRGGDTVSLPEIAVLTEAYGSIHTYKASDNDKYQLKSLSGKVSVGPNDILDVIIYDEDIHDSNPNLAPTGTPIEWSIVDLTTNYKISTGKFIVP